MERELALPLGPLYLASTLLACGHRVSIVDTCANYLLKELVLICSDDTLCFGISTMSGIQLANAIQIARLLKDKYPHVPIIWGGVHVSLFPEQTLQSGLADYIVCGEGEDTIGPLVSSIRHNNNRLLNGIPGIGYKDGKDIIVGQMPGNTLLENSKDLPYHLLNMERYKRKLVIGANRDYVMLTSRGCAYRCTFCVNSSSDLPNSKMRYHSIDYIVKNVKTLVRKYGADMISIIDECFMTNAQRAVDLLSAIRKEGIFIKYRFTTRINLLLKLTESTWETLKEYGVVAVGIAPESGSQRVLNNMNKGITLEHIYKINDLLSKYGFYKTYNFLICSPSESREDLKHTLKLILDLAPTALSSPYPLGSFNRYMPMPGTKLYTDAIKHGLVPPTNLEGWAKFEFERNKINFDNYDEARKVRPWLSKDDFDFTNKASFLLKELNGKFTGSGAKTKQIDESLKRISCLIREG